MKLWTCVFTLDNFHLLIVLKNITLILMTDFLNQFTNNFRKNMKENLIFIV